MIARHTLVLLMLSASIPTYAQFQQQQSDTISADKALDEALKHSSLTEGKAPFHAVLEISGPSPAYSGGIDLLWAAKDQYRIKIDSPAFHQLRILNGTQVSEKDEGNYYPRWLENFVDALLDPIPMAANFKGRNGAVSVGSFVTNSCIRRDDRPGGITDQLTWGMICFSGSEPRLASTLTTNSSLDFSDFKSFGKQQIAHTYTTDVLDYKPVTGRLTVLEKLKGVDASQFAIPSPTPASERIKTTFVSTLKEESLVDDPPTLNWPSVHEGKTEGYMIVYARTDRTGQVRETSKHNSDNPGLEQFGMEQALRYKFHPLIIDGVPQQMEMPLVLHFVSRVENPLPNLNDAQTRAQITGCEIPHAETGQPSYLESVSVNEQGKLTGEGFPDANKPGFVSPTQFLDLESCHFAPHLVNGQPTYYHGLLTLPR
ncbi:hypothetical protein [Granulicella tundricola]|uniref:TonB C-terminal domain-containing protein n=1 Tax=Granulicella tundricola (strain ATCC BAA-1859 / DSM 23138 / MP5ACTX9) TaxID=1198114 RepID=E8X5L3_GRATM|nr:hypothetical protein [Granulicella tundricola]ADW70640.1 hypothetical protein AciX9_3637 [Granulicella tundricola MP5ACTX9]